MSGKSLKKNYIYNVSYQILTLVTPLVTSPYLSRTLGVDGIGRVSFAESIVAYFVLFATFGMVSYGRREISYCQGNREKCTVVFWENKLLQVCFVFIALLVYIPFSFTRADTTIFLILVFNLVDVITDITWFFQGLEEFKKIVLRNAIIKIISIAFIFIFVKNSNDYITYAFCLSFFPCIGNASLWAYLPRYIDLPVLSKLKPLRNFKTIVSLFIPSIAIQVYTVLDKTMLGVITKGTIENGYYEQALKISRMTLTIVTALGTVMIPRIGYHYSKGETETVCTYMYRAYKFVCFLGIPLCFGLIGVSSNVVPWFLGDGFDQVIPLLRILSFLILAIGINNVTGMQYLIPTKRQNIFTITVIVGAVVNFVLNWFLITLYQSTGAAIASVIAEATIAILQLILVRKELSIKIIVCNSYKYIISGIIMLILLTTLGNILSSSIAHSIIMIMLGAATYFAFLLLLKDDFLIYNIKTMTAKLKDK